MEKIQKKVFTKQLMDKPKAVIQEKTGCIVGMKNINLEIKKGEFYILMGLSGSGKSTLIRSLIHLVKPTKGMIKINDQNLTKMNSEQLLQF